MKKKNLFFIALCAALLLSKTSFCSEIKPININNPYAQNNMDNIALFFKTLETKNFISIQQANPIVFDIKLKTPLDEQMFLSLVFPIFENITIPEKPTGQMNTNQKHAYVTQLLRFWKDLITKIKNNPAHIKLNQPDIFYLQQLQNYIHTYDSGGELHDSIKTAIYYMNLLLLSHRKQQRQQLQAPKPALSPTIKSKKRTLLPRITPLLPPHIDVTKE